MLKLGKITSGALFMAAFLAAMTGCEKKEGPLEKAGKEIDQAVEKVVEPKTGPAEQAGQSIDNATEKTGQQIEKAGDKIQDAAKGN